MRKILGYSVIFASALFFYLATYFMKIALRDENISALLFVEARFLLGFLVFFPFFLFQKREIKLVNRKEILIRAFSNSLAVLAFFLGVQWGTVTNANLINMTYPAFVALFAPFLAAERIDKFDLWALILTITGVLFLFLHSGTAFLSGDLWSLVSAILSGWAIVSLRIVRKTDSTLNILTVVFGFGMALFLPVFWIYPFPELQTTRLLLFLTAVMGVLGQLFLTYGYRFVNAMEGSIISSSRIIIALLVGGIILEEQVGFWLIVGAIFIFISHLVEAAKAVQGKNEKKGP